VHLDHPHLVAVASVLAGSDLVADQPQTQKHAFTQIRGAGSVWLQPHIVLFPWPAQSVSLLHSLWQLQLGNPPGPPQPQR
jgi:hypothetical protein